MDPSVMDDGIFQRHDMLAYKQLYYWMVKVLSERVEQFLSLFESLFSLRVLLPNKTIQKDLNHPYKIKNRPVSICWMQKLSVVRCICGSIQNDVINNNKALEQKPAFKEQMQPYQYEMNRQDPSVKQSHQTDNPQIQQSDWRIKEEDVSFQRANIFWTRDQQRLFLLFWMQKLVVDPLKMYSFDNPLKRSHHFQELSHFLASNLGSQLAKSDQQCKSKFATIRRKIQREKAKGRRTAQYGFIDYIIEEGKKIAEELPAMIGPLGRVQEMRATDSDFMTVTRKMLRMERREGVELKNNSIYAYLMQVDRLPQVMA